MARHGKTAVGGFVMEPRAPLAVRHRASYIHDMFLSNNESAA